jgi:hypothetical protein
MKKTIFLVILVVSIICSIILIGCTPEELENLDNLTGGEGIDTPFEAYNYFITSIGKLLSSAETVELNGTYYDHDVEDGSEIMFQKNAGVCYSPISYTSPKAYYDGKMYFRDNFTSFATTTLEQFIAVSFFANYNYEVEHFLFADTITFTEEEGGHKLVVIINLGFHLYTYELITDENDSFVSAKFSNVNEWIDRETRLVNRSLTGVVPSFEMLTGNTDETALWQNAANLSSAIYTFSQSPEIKKQTYVSQDGNGYSIAPIATYNINQTQVLFTDDNGGYGYYLNNNFYTYDTEADATYNQKTYTEGVGIYFCKYFTVWDLFYPMYDIEQYGLTVTQDSPGAGKTKYQTGDYSYVLTGSVIEECVYYNEYAENPYEKYVLSTDADVISAPQGFNPDAFLSDAEAAVVSQVDWALGACNDQLNEQNPSTQTDLRDALYLNYYPPILTEYPTNFTERTFYIVVGSLDSELSITQVIGIVYGENGYYVKGQLGSGSIFEYEEFARR